MRRRVIVAGVLVMMSAVTGCQTRRAAEVVAVKDRKSFAEHSPEVFLVSYDAETGKGPLLKAIEEYGIEIVYDYKIISGMALKKPAGKSLEETMEYIRKVEGVVAVEYDHIIKIDDPVKPRLEAM